MYLLPRSKENVEAIPIDHELWEVMKALSTVDEEHWYLMQKCEKVLRDEEERFGKKVERAGTGWGMERWTKMFWTPKKVNVHHNQNHTQREKNERDEGGENSDSDGSDYEENHQVQEPQQDSHAKMGRQNKVKMGATSNAKSKPTSKPSKSKRRKKKAGNGLSKEERAKAMAAALHEERVEMERQGRGIVGTEDIRRAMKGEPAVKKAQNLGDKKEGKAAKHKKDEGTETTAPLDTDHVTLPHVNVPASSSSDHQLPKKKKTRKSQKSKPSTPADSSTLKLPDHRGRAPPQELWDFDPSIEILSTGGEEELTPQIICCCFYILMSQI